MQADFDADSFAAGILRAEIAALNAELRFDAPLRVVVETCGEANAFYDPNDRLVIFCTEFEGHLRAMYQAL